MAVLFCSRWFAFMRTTFVENVGSFRIEPFCMRKRAPARGATFGSVFLFGHPTAFYECRSKDRALSFCRRGASAARDEDKPGSPTAKQKRAWSNDMIEKERDAVKLMLLMNAIQFLVLDCPPHSDCLEVDMISLIPQMRMVMEENEPSAICAGALAGYYTDSIEAGTPAARAHVDYPDLYAQMEIKFLGNSCIRNFLSVVADAYRDDGEPTIYNRLVAKNAYVSSSPGKDYARSGLSITPKKRGFWASLFG